MKKGIFCVLVCMLMIISTIIPVSGTLLTEKTSHPLSKGNILYVGGSGPTNYSRIQDAIDNATDGDMVFVYDDSSPYHESLKVNIPLVLQGENKNTTIIDNSNTVNHGVFINANNVTVTGFTIQNGGTGVYIGGPGSTASHSIITENLFFNRSAGIDIYYGDPFTPEFTNYGYHIISNNVIRYTKFYGIRIVEGRNNILSRNDIAPGDEYNASYGYGYGIWVTGAFNNISFNTVCENEREGICSSDSYKNVMYRNTIEDNKGYGLLLVDASFDRVIQNNFIDNTRSARIFNAVGLSLESHKGYYLILPSFWDGNYWGGQRMLPYPIGGLLLYKSMILFIIYDILVGGENYEKLLSSTINFLRFDWHPAQEPYDIPEVS